MTNRDKSFIVVPFLITQLLIGGMTAIICKAMDTQTKQIKEHIDGMKFRLHMVIPLQDFIEQTEPSQPVPQRPYSIQEA